jgi:FtsH-binding integral membrane protein
MHAHAESSILSFIKKMKNSQNSKTTKNSLQHGGKLIPKFDLTILTDKAGFLSSVFGTLLIQLVVVGLVVYFVAKKTDVLSKIKKWYIALFLGMLVIILVLAFVPMHPFLKFILFTVYSALTGLIVAVATSQVSKDVIYASVLGTTAVFGLFLALGILLTVSGFNLSWLGIVLFFALLIVIIVSIVVFVMKEDKRHFRKILAVIILIIFSLYIMYDTFSILQRDYSGDFVTAAIDYFLDIINIFLQSVSLMTNTSNM